MNKRKLLRRLTLLAILAALAVVLRIFAITIIANNRIIFHNIPIMISGLLFGPTSGVLVAFVADITAIAYEPRWDILYMLPQLLWGLVPGLFKYVFNYRRIGMLFVIEGITHLLVSIGNTLVMWGTLGLDIALGKISVKEFTFSISIFNETINIITIGEFLYLRIVFVIIIMLIKIPIDVLLLRVIDKRVIEKMALKML